EPYRESAKCCALHPASSQPHERPRRRRRRDPPFYAPFFHWASTPANHSEWRRRFPTARSACDTPRQGKASPPKCNRSRAGLHRRHAAIRAIPLGHCRRLETGAGARQEPEANAAPPTAAKARPSVPPSDRSGQGQGLSPYPPNRMGSGLRDRGVCRTASEPTPGPWSSMARMRPAFSVPPTADEMIVHHAGCLAKGIDDGRAAEIEASTLQILGDTRRERGLCRDLAHVAIAVLQALSLEKAPQIVGKAFVFLDFQKSAGRGYATFDFCAVADDTGILHEGFDLGAIVAGDLVRVEIVEGGAESLALAQYCDPGQPRLESVEKEFFKKRPAVALRHAPFLIMIGDVKRVIAGPWATRFAAGRGKGAGVLNHSTGRRHS